MRFVRKEVQRRLVIVASHVLPTALSIDKHVVSEEANVENIGLHKRQLA